ncbi:MAG: CAP domain-containing protein [Anaerolineales bacterium]
MNRSLMKKWVSWFVFLCLMIGWVATTQPVQAENGVIGTPPGMPDPDSPVLQFSGCGGEVVSPQNKDFEQQVIDLVNQERSSRGLTPLEYSEGLTRAARYQAADMSQDNYFSHDTMDWIGGKLDIVCDPWSRISNYYSGANGENAAAGYSSPTSVVEGWMKSDGHRANILNPATRTIGVGFYQGNGDYHYYWVQDFGTQVDALTAPALGDLPDELLFFYSIPDQKLYPSYLSIPVTNIGNQDPLSYQLDSQGTFFSATPGTGTTPASIQVKPDNFNPNIVATQTGAITIQITNPSSVQGAPHTSQITLQVINSQMHQVFLPGINK